MRNRVTSALLRALLLLSCAVCVFPATAQQNPEDIVLVTSANSDVSPLSTLDLRKIFLGLPVTQPTGELSAFLYRPDSETHEVFLKAIIGMTARSYDRKVLQARLSFGAKLVESFEDTEELSRVLEAETNSISFMTYADAERYQLIVIQTLWQSQN